MSTKLNAEELSLDYMRPDYMSDTDKMLEIKRYQRIGYAAAIREEVEPRDRLLQEMVDALSRSIKCPEGCFGGAIPTMPDGEPEQCRWCFEHSDGISAITKAKEQFGITPTP